MVLSSAIFHCIVVSCVIKTHLDLHCAGSQSSDFLLHTVSNTGVHGGATRHDIVGIQVLPDVNIALHDAVVGCLMNTSGFHTWWHRQNKGMGGGI